MKLIIHDGKPNSLSEKGDVKLIDSNSPIKRCIGCFGCWVKTPAHCVLRDGYGNMPELFGQATEIVLVTECYYGGYSPFVKNVIDRSIGYLLPFFKIINNEMHHQLRYTNKPTFSVHFYGADITAREKITAESLVSRNAINFGTESYSTTFYASFEHATEGLI